MKKLSMFCLTTALSLTPVYAFSFDLDPFNLKDKAKHKKEKVTDLFYFTHYTTEKTFDYLEHKHNKKKNLVTGLIDHKVEKTEKVIDFAQDKHEKKKEFVTGVIDHKVEKTEKIIDFAQDKHEKKKEFVTAVIDHKVEKTDKVISFALDKHEKKKEIVTGLIDHKSEKAEKVISAVHKLKSELIPDHKPKPEIDHTGTWLLMWASEGKFKLNHKDWEGHTTGEGFSILKVTDTGSVISTSDCSEDTSTDYSVIGDKLIQGGKLIGTFKDKHTLIAPAIEYTKSSEEDGISITEVGHLAKIMVKLSDKHNALTAWHEDASDLAADLFCSVYSLKQYKSKDLLVELSNLKTEGPTINESWKEDKEYGVLIKRKVGAITAFEPGRKIMVGFK